MQRINFYSLFHRNSVTENCIRYRMFYQSETVVFLHDSYFLLKATTSLRLCVPALIRKCFRWLFFLIRGYINDKSKSFKAKSSMGLISKGCLKTLLKSYDASVWLKRKHFCWSLILKMNKSTGMTHDALHWIQNYYENKTVKFRYS